jgi:hypothetical protein
VDALLPRARDGRVSSEGLLSGGPNAASVHGLYDIAGDVVLRPATIARLEGMPEMVRWRLMDVRYVVSRRTFDAGEPVRLIQRHGDVGLYEVQLGVAPAWVPLTWTESWSAFWNPAPDFDPMAEAVVPDAYAGMRSEGVWASGDTSGSAELVGLEPGRAVVQAHLADQGYLVWSSLDVPASLIGNAFGVPASGWSATAESLTAVGTGSAAAALYPRVGTRPAFTETPAYGVSPAVALPAGDWSVTWTYVPSGLHLGLALSGAATLLGALLWLRRPALGR